MAYLPHRMRTMFIMGKNTCYGLIVLLVSLMLLTASCHRGMERIEQYGIFQLQFEVDTACGKWEEGEVLAYFKHESGGKSVVRGFYYGEGRYMIRFMPALTGIWSYHTKSEWPGVRPMKGRFCCIRPSGGNHGPVNVDSTHSTGFRHASGKRFDPFGNTVYGMTQADRETYRATLASLDTFGMYRGTRPFNKVRLSALPHRPSFEAQGIPFGQEGEDLQIFGAEDTAFQNLQTRWFSLLDTTLTNLLELGYQAELILFHSNAVPDPEHMPPDVMDRLLKYMVARYGAFRNVWWSLANEYAYISTVDTVQWNRLGRLLRECETWPHLASIHTPPRGSYNWDQNWITHISVQWAASHPVSGSRHLRETIAHYGKPLVNDEFRYEGSADFKPFWGNLQPPEVVDCFWRHLVNGAYATYGETYRQQFFRIGGAMSGLAPERIAFARWVIASMGEWKPLDSREGILVGDRGRSLCYLADPDTLLFFKLPGKGYYTVEELDTWRMSLRAVDTVQGMVTLQASRPSVFLITELSGQYR